MFPILCGLLAVIALAVSPAPAAPAGPAPILLGALKIGGVEVPKLSIASVDSRGKQTFVELPVPEQTPGAALEVPFGSEIQIYEGSGNGDGSAPKPYLKVPAKQPGQKLLLVFFPDDAGRLQHAFFDNSEQAHPGGYVRVINLCNSRIAFSVGGTPIQVPPGAEASSAPVYDDAGKFGFRFFEERPSEPPYASPLARLRYKFPDQRLLVILANLPEEVATGETSADGTAATKKIYRCQRALVFDRTGNPAGGAKVAGSAAAQPAPSSLSTNPARVAPAQREISLVSFSRAGAGPFNISQGGKNFPVEIRPGNIARASIPFSEDPSLAVSSTSGPPADGRAHLPENSRDNLLAITDEPGGGFRVEAFENSQLSHPPGQARLFNLTPHEVAFTAGGKIVRVNPMQAELLPEIPAGGLPWKVALQADGRWQILADSSLSPVPASSRRLIFVCADPGSGKYEILQKDQ